MNPALLIARKRDGQTLAPEEIAKFVSGYVRGEIPDYQMSALAMAIYLRGMEPAETAALTREMLYSGSTLQWPAGGPARVDKHSTGGVGDKISLLLAPLLACCGLAVPMISGRGLGATGGTLDKLESIPGYRTNLSAEEIARIVAEVGCVITGQTADLVPADKKLYALRDVTATVASIPLITASIMSKKLAENLDALVLDVKFGSGAFMKSRDEAHQLAESMVSVGAQMGLRVSALLTDMNQPLGRMIGHAVEVNESIEALAGQGPADVMDLTLALGEELLVLCGSASSLDQARQRLREELDSGRALEKFRQMIRAQGGDPDAPRRVAPASAVTAATQGFVSAVDCEALGNTVVVLGGGRTKVTDAVDHSVGLEMLVRIGQRVEAGQELVRIFAEQAAAERVRDAVAAAVTISTEAPPPMPLVVERIGSERQQLIFAAQIARQRAHAPYSGYLVGAALRTTDGEIFSGCNVENASYGLTICAERVAITTAIAAGRRHFDSLALVTADGAPPCGACRQVLAEFCEDLPILIVAADGSRPVTETTLRELLPGRFELRK